MEELGREEKWGLGRVSVCVHVLAREEEEATSEDPVAPVAINNRF